MSLPEPHVAHQFDDLAQQNDAASLGMWVFLASEAMFFGAIFTAYFMCRMNNRDAFAEASHNLDVMLGTVNTVVLLTSSLTMALAVRAAHLGRRQSTTALLMATVGLGAVFLAIKFSEYAHKYEQGLVPFLRTASDTLAGHDDHQDLFYNFYYAMTGLHAVHMLIGMAVLGILAALVWRGRYAGGNTMPIEATGLYWHFVDVVWVFLFPCLYLLDLARD